MRPLGAQTAGEFQLLAPFAGSSQRSQGLGGRKVRGGAELTRSITQQAPLNRNRLGRQPGKIQGEALDTGACTPPSPHRAATNQNLCGQALDL